MTTFLRWLAEYEPERMNAQADRCGSVLVYSGASHAKYECDRPSEHRGAHSMHTPVGLMAWGHIASDQGRATPADQPEPPRAA